MVESAGVMCQNYYTIFMMICEHLRRNLAQHCVGDLSGCFVGINVGKA